MIRIRVLLSVATILFTTQIANAAHLFEETQKLTAIGGEIGELFGWSVGISDDRAIVGALGALVEGGRSGAAYVFELDGGGNWAQVERLTPSSAVAGDNFGRSVAISGNWALVGAVGEIGNGSSAGAAYIFERDSIGNWVEIQKLNASDAAFNDAFGVSVAISGNRAIVGARFDDDSGVDSGSAYVFERDSSGNWVEVQKLIASDGVAGAWFGWSVAIDGDRAVVGASQNVGSAYVYERDGSGVWMEMQKLTASDVERDDWFGVSVAISGDRAFVGAPLNDDSGDDSGSAYVFERGGAGIWSEVQKLTASDAAAGQLFGLPVAISGTWAFVAVLRDGDNGPNSGATYVFERDGSGTWSQVQKLFPGDAAPYRNFGRSVAASGSWLIVGTPGGGGAAYMFTIPSEHPPVFIKEIVGGPDRNEDQEIDRAIWEHGGEPSEFTFTIFYNQPQLPETGVCIEDHIPFQWEVLNCTPSEETDLVLMYPTGHEEHGHFHYRATQIQWYPSSNSGELTVTVRTRPHSDNRWEPHKCMCLLLNEGAVAVDSSTSEPYLDDEGAPLVTNRLFIAALHDQNHDHMIDYSGNGDEDGDGLTDYEECELGTDPCHHDTDGDHIDDGEDPDPLDKNVPGRLDPM